jgi:hypothetical protein
VILMPYSPASVGDLTEQMRNAIFVGSEMAKEPKKKE